MDKCSLPSMEELLGPWPEKVTVRDSDYRDLIANPVFQMVRHEVLRRVLKKRMQTGVMTANPADIAADLIQARSFEMVFELFDDAAKKCGATSNTEASR